MKPDYSDPEQVDKALSAADQKIEKIAEAHKKNVEATEAIFTTLSANVEVVKAVKENPTLLAAIGETELGKAAEAMKKDEDEKEKNKDKTATTDPELEAVKAMYKDSLTDQLVAAYREIDPEGADAYRKEISGHSLTELQGTLKNPLFVKMLTASKATNPRPFDASAPRTEVETIDMSFNAKDEAGSPEGVKFGEDRRAGVA